MMRSIIVISWYIWFQRTQWVSFGFYVLISAYEVDVLADNVITMIFLDSTALRWNLRSHCCENLIFYNVVTSCLKVVQSYCRMDYCGFLGFGHLTPRESPLSPLNSRLNGPQCWCGCFGGKKNLFLLSGFKPWIIHFVAYSLCWLLWPSDFHMQYIIGVNELRCSVLTVLKHIIRSKQ